jgi:hypothetical protein
MDRRTCHCIKTGRWKLESRATLGILSILVAFSLLGWIYLTQASHTAITSRRMQELEVDKVRLQQENMQLMAEIAELESVTQLAARAKALGFVHMQTEDVEFLVIADPQTPGESGTRQAVAASPSLSALADTTPGIADGWWANFATQFATWAGLEGP